MKIEKKKSKKTNSKLKKTKKPTANGKTIVRDIWARPMLRRG
jgi:hypothetical protein